MGATVVWPGVFGIAIFAEAGLRTEVLWEMLAALAIDHAGGTWDLGATGTMHHAFCDCGIEHGVSDGIGDLS
jgi:hypothetical protein